MGIFDNVGDQVAAHKDKIDGAIEQGGDFIDDKTGGKYADQVNQGQDFLQGKVDDLSRQDDEPAQ